MNSNRISCQFSRTAIALAAVIASCQLTLRAVEPSPTDVIELSPFEVKTRAPYLYAAEDTSSAALLNRKVIETPLTINVITSDFMAAAGIEDLTDIRKYVAGLDVRGNSTFSSDFTGRGFRVETLVNGHRGRIFQDTAIVERIEVVRGPMSTLYGESGGGGIANVSYKEPQFRNNRIELLGGYGNQGYMKGRFDANASGKMGNGGELAVRAIVYYSNYDGAVDGFFTKRNGAYLAANWAITDRLLLKVKYDRLNYSTQSKDPGTYIVGGPDLNGNGLVDIDYKNNYGVNPRTSIWGPDSIWPWRQDTYNADLIFNVTNNIIYRFSGNINQQEMGDAIATNNNSDARPASSTIPGYTGTPFSASTTKKRAIYVQRTRDITSIKNDLVVKGEGLSSKAQLILGYEFYKNTDLEQREAFTLTTLPIVQLLSQPGILKTPAFVDAVAGVAASTPGYAYDPANSRGSGSGSKSDSYRATAVIDTLNEHLHMIAGYRLNRGDALILPVRATDTRKAYPFDQSTYNVGAIYDLWRKSDSPDRISAYVSQGTSLVPQRQNDINNNPLPAETGEGMDAGIKFSAKGGRITGGLAYFDLSRDNVAKQVSLNPVIWEANGSEASKGFEAELHAQVTKGLNLMVTYTDFDAKVTANKQTPQMVGVATDTPATTYAFWADYRFKEGRLSGLSMALGYHYRSGYVGHAGAPTKLDQIIPSAGLWDAKVGYAFKLMNKPTSIDLGIENLTDKEWINVLSSDPQLQPGYGIQFKLNVTMTF